MTAGRDDDAFAEKLAALIAAFRAVGREVLASPDGRVAWARANELQAAMERGSEVAWLRAKGAAWIRDAEHMSLAELATELGLTRARAQQFAKSAKEDRSGEFDP
jgi:hypothetical protein